MLGKTVSQLLSECSSLELAEWMAYEQLEPWGEDRADVRSAIVASVVHNVNCTKQGQMLPPSKFCAFTEPTPPQTPDDMKNVCNALERMNHGAGWVTAGQPGA